MRLKILYTSAINRWPGWFQARLGFDMFVKGKPQQQEQQHHNHPGNRPKIDDTPSIRSKHGEHDVLKSQLNQWIFVVISIMFSQTHPIEIRSNIYIYIYIYCLCIYIYTYTYIYI